MNERAKRELREGFAQIYQRLTYLADRETCLEIIYFLSNILEQRPKKIKKKNIFNVQHIKSL